MSGQEGVYKEGRKWKKGKKGRRRREVRIGHKKSDAEQQQRRQHDRDRQTDREERERETEQREKRELWGDMAHRIKPTIIIMMNHKHNKDSRYGSLEKTNACQVSTRH